MSKTHYDLEAQLTAATARRGSDALIVEAETRELRAGWLSLGRSLAAENHDWDEAALIARLTAALPQQVALPQEQPPATLQAWLVTSALAAALLLCAGLTLYRTQVPAGKHGLPLASSLPMAASEAAPPGALAPRAWNDPLDEQIAQAALRIESFHPGWHDLDGSFSALNEQLDTLSRDLDGGSL